MDSSCPWIIHQHFFFHPFLNCWWNQHISPIDQNETYFKTSGLFSSHSLSFAIHQWKGKPTRDEQTHNNKNELRHEGESIKEDATNHTPKGFPMGSFLGEWHFVRRKAVRKQDIHHEAEHARAVSLVVSCIQTDKKKINRTTGNQKREDLNWISFCDVFAVILFGHQF